MNHTLCFGEFLLRLSPQLNGEWIRQSSMPVYIGGAELNVATALALWRQPVKYFSALPDHYLSKEICKALNEKGIDTSVIHFGGSRIGTYYLPQGADLKNAGVIYDRSHSSFSELKPGQINWDAVLDGINWFHFSAISPALGKNAAAVCLEAVMAASEKGITVSVDLNYRAKLWQWGAQPADIMPGLVKYCNVVMGNIWAAETMLGIALDAHFTRTKESCLAQAQKTSAAIIESFPACRQVANTFRFDEADGGIHYYATLFNQGRIYVAPEQRSGAVVDKAGSGDCFMAGLIMGNQKGYTAQQTVDFAAAAAFDKLFVKGDATTSLLESIEQKAFNHAR